MTKLINHKWLIYLLFNQSAIPIYVGSTNDLKRRLKEHKKVLGYKPQVQVLETGVGVSRNDAESKWIKLYRRINPALSNKLTDTFGGRWVQTQASREHWSMIKKGKKKPDGWGERIGAVTRGKPHDWTPEGREAAAKTQFKPGRKRTAQEDEKLYEGIRIMWDAIPHDQRSKMATARNNDAWAQRSPEERSAIGKKIAKARERNLSQERRSEISSQAARAAAAKPGAQSRLSSQVKNWWASLTPEAKAAFVSRRAEKIAAAR